MVILAQLFLRVGSAAGALVVGSYFVDLSQHGVHVNSILLGVLSGLTYLTELVFAPFAGASSDRHGRRIFLVSAPLIGAVGILITPGASVWDAAPPLLLVIVAVLIARLVEGAGAAMATPVTLGLLASATEGDRRRRGRLASMYELSSSGGIAVGAALGPVLYVAAGLWAFAILAGVYGAAGLMILVFVRESSGASASRPSGRRRGWPSLLRDRRLVAFLPAWVAVNAILGVWVTAQITFVLAGNSRVPGQLFPGALAGHEARLSAILGGYVLVFSACVAGWAPLVGRLPTKPTLFATIGGSVIASAGLLLANHGLSVVAAAPILLVGIFLEAGFTPTALSYLADISSTHSIDRGLLMGLYSVVLSIGYLLGNVLGGLFATWWAFDGLAVLTIALAVAGMVSVTVMVRIDRARHGGHPHRAALSAPVEP
ncbi:MAG: MFS transporter [Leifsonia sp.]